MSNYYDFTIRLISRFLNDIPLDCFSGVYLSDGITAIISLVNYFSDFAGYLELFCENTLFIAFYFLWSETTVIYKYMHTSG